MCGACRKTTTVNGGCFVVGILRLLNLLPEPNAGEYTKCEPHELGKCGNKTKKLKSAAHQSSVDHKIDMNTFSKRWLLNYLFIIAVLGNSKKGSLGRREGLADLYCAADGKNGAFFCDIRGIVDVIDLDQRKAVYAIIIVM